jgi:hypothetical protein
MRKYKPVSDTLKFRKPWLSEKNSYEVDDGQSYKYDVLHENNLIKIGKL